MARVDSWEQLNALLDELPKPPPGTKRFYRGQVRDHGSLVPAIGVPRMRGTQRYHLGTSMLSEEPMLCELVTFGSPVPYDQVRVDEVIPQLLSEHDLEEDMGWMDEADRTSLRASKWNRQESH